MMRFLALGLVLSLLVQSLSMLLPARLLLHDHLLVGIVTAEQLRAHLASEAQDVQNLDRSGAVPGLPSNDLSVTATGGRIISEVAGLGLILILHLELSLQVASLLLILMLVYSLGRVRLRLQALVLALSNPPPRPARISC